MCQVLLRGNLEEAQAAPRRWQGESAGIQCCAKFSWISGEAVAKFSPGEARASYFVEDGGVRDRRTQFGPKVFVIPRDGCKARIERHTVRGGAVEPRTINSFGSSTLGCALSSTCTLPSSITRSSRSAACSPNCRMGWPTVVRDGLASAAKGMLSKPMIETSSG